MATIIGNPTYNPPPAGAITNPSPATRGTETSYGGAPRPPSGRRSPGRQRPSAGGGYGGGRGGFNPQTFDPFNPQFGVPGLTGGYPTMDMLRYITETAFNRRAQNSDALRLGMDISRQPMNWTQWWEMTYGNKDKLGGMPVPSFVGLGGQEVPQFQMPGINLDGQALQMPSAQGFGRMSPSALGGLQGLFERLGVPWEDVLYAAGIPTQGLGGSAPAVMAPRMR